MKSRFKIGQDKIDNALALRLGLRRQTTVIDLLRRRRRIRSDNARRQGVGLRFVFAFQERLRYGW
jgi:hypothetical protein